jgi:hypothetical protein
VVAERHLFRIVVGHTAAILVKILHYAFFGNSLLNRCVVVLAARRVGHEQSERTGI